MLRATCRAPRPKVFVYFGELVASSGELYFRCTLWEAYLRMLDKFVDFVAETYVDDIVVIRARAVE